MGKIINFLKYKQCRPKKLTNTYSSNNFQFVHFPEEFYFKSLSQKEIEFANKQLIKIIDSMQAYSYTNNPDTKTLDTLLEQHSLYTKVIEINSK